MSKKVKYTSLSILGILLIAYYFLLPGKLFNDPYSTILLANKGELLSASIAADGQWRFPETDTLPANYIKALVTYEDKRFFSHPGFDWRAIARATRQNLQSGHIVSGGSTISMQVIRLSRKSKSRNVLEKLIEIVLATRLELRYSKEEILHLYASHAPFGGNVVGIEAACWRYFGRSLHDLSWGEAALLAVLPNAPSLLHPGRNPEALKVKRNQLLDRLLEHGIIDEFTCQLGKTEPIPDKPQALPRMARHALQHLVKAGYDQSKNQTGISFSLQKRVEQLLEEQHRNLAANKINNAAAIVLDTKTGEVLAYAGNILSDKKNSFQNEVDIINAPRSTGSILKPFLFAAMLDQGEILTKTLLPDIPTFINGFAPKNFSKQYDGAVPADKALIRSLNIPAVHLLKQYRYEKFHTLLKSIGMSTLQQAPDHYGLSLILGGAEGSLWDITGMYASMGRVLNNYFEHPGMAKYNPKDWHAPRLLQFADTTLHQALEQNSHMSAASIYQTLEVLTEVYRPGEETGWRYFSNSKKIAWKTGTSYGFRDGWAIGVTPEYTVGVWVGNADGEGRPGLTGTDAASPLMFSIFSQLPATTWFKKPSSEFKAVSVCALSGHRIGAHCERADTLSVQESGLKSEACPNHRLVHLTQDKKFRVSSACAAVSTMHTQSWFVLPPVQEYYYKSRNIAYRPLPRPKPGCPESINHMDLIYPKSNARVFIPRGLDGNLGQVIFELAHSQTLTTVYWHLNDQYIGATRGKHEMALNPLKGKHTITLVDDEGHSLTRQFEVISDM
ncbi:penicillin-binding protein 1C [Chryseotalea sanaruensis]|uniref:peptidoglycan glycosyltransferase n=1 Tax=Chryseotalea sanaruensis TaxID=2482724 RepID=A0A401UBU2_9BACT|nr:penicillin-binding protein 1C [Chryseotalea sanaruensis]GCC52359.1 penicillin-binding protein 1C [Chryseotalea sanaruensis]